MIRRATSSDVPAISELMASKVPHFRNEGVHFSAETYEAQLLALMALERAGGDAVCFVSEAGDILAAAIVCCVVLHPTIGERIGTEVTWAAKKEFAGHGRLVLKAAEDWFRERGVSRFFAACNDDRTAQLLMLLGFNETERVFEKML